MEHHRRGLRRLLKDDELLAAIEADFAAAPISEQRMVMLRYADKLTRTPWAMTRRDVEELAEAGFGDRDVLDIAELVAYYAYANRIADGLGVETERWIDFAD